ncbi:TIR-like protein FxsC [Dactylosporangium sp. CA-052675]|uniref:TIR-like protein FxsC n=1 Tax=Dactylosporangium sp. CA-052675 TaxID=3239927 RepID=UPI003D8BBF35
MSPAPPQRRCWFFLSYAHSQPLPGREETDTDGNVRTLFGDLSAEVARLVGAEPGTRVGFFAALAEPGSDWKARQGEMLAQADVFVALYSPNYFNKSWPMRERAAFLQRLDAALPAGQRQRHVMPVLWVPLPTWDDVPERGAALALGHGVPEYQENGLRALCMLKVYQPAYRRIVERLARQIVAVAGSSSLRPTPAVPIDEVRFTPPAADGEKPFLVGVLAPTLEHLPPGRSPAAYGPNRQWWRPFAAMRELSLAEYAANAAERRGLPTRLIDSAVDDDVRLLDTCPALLLVDPWTFAAAGAGDILAPIVKHLHDWVTFMVVIDRHDPEHSGRGAELYGEVTARLGRIGARRITAVQDLDELAYRLPAIVDGTRKEYLSTGEVFPPSGPRQEPPRLNGRPDPGTSGNDTSGNRE